MKGHGFLRFLPPLSSFNPIAPSSSIPRGSRKIHSMCEQALPVVAIGSRTRVLCIFHFLSHVYPILVKAVINGLAGRSSNLHATLSIPNDKPCHRDQARHENPCIMLLMHWAIRHGSLCHKIQQGIRHARSTEDDVRSRRPAVICQQSGYV